MLLQTVIIINNLLQLTWIILQLTTAIFFSIKMFKVKRYNLLPLILSFLIDCSRIIFFALIPEMLIILLTLNQFSAILLVIFTKLTFFKYKKSPFVLFLTILIIVRSIDYIIRLNTSISIPTTFIISESDLGFYYYILFSITISFILSYFWLGIVALKYFNSIKSVKVEPWIKKRYQLIGLGSLIYSFSIIFYYLYPYNVIGISAFPNIIYNYIIVFFTIFYSVCMFIAWIMPKKLKSYFNKDYKIREEKEYSEDELMERINNELKSNQKAS